MEKYILMMTFATPSASNEVKWEMFDRLEAAQKSLEVYQKQTENYRRFPVLLGPVLLQHVIFRVVSE